MRAGSAQNLRRDPPGTKPGTGGGLHGSAPVADAGVLTGPAPYHADVARGPADVQSHWLRCADGIRLRLAVWNAGLPQAKGTVLLFAGRTEYVEKYGLTAQSLAERGYRMASVDWRGQGLSDRALPDHLTGHVTDFREFQTDVAALRAALSTLDVAGPFFLLGHSMGGCIGLRALHEGLPVAAAAFSGPMWGIRIAPQLRPAAWALSGMSRYLGLSHRYAPGTKPASYITAAPFEGNVLTSDPEMYEYMRLQLAAHPELALGGPSLSWLYAALREINALHRMPSPPVPALTHVGTEETIVDVPTIRDRMRRWSDGTLTLAQGGQHEIPMEVPALRDAFFDDCDRLFSAAR